MLLEVRDGRESENEMVTQFTLLPDFDVGLINTVGRAAHLEMRAYSLIELRGIPLNPSEEKSFQGVLSRGFEIQWSIDRD